MITQFRIWDTNDKEYPGFFDSTKEEWKMMIKRLDLTGAPFRTGVIYEDEGATPVKLLTILEDKRA